MIHVMLDLETWGLTPGSDLRSIGACVFAPETGLVHDGSLGTIRPFYAATSNPKGYWGMGSARGRFFADTKGWERKYRLVRDPKTVQWWSEQSEAAQAAFEDPVDLKAALERITVWLNDLCSPDAVAPATGHTNLSLWSHGPAFDPPILAAAIDAVGLSVPWHYRTLRDTRTCFDLAGIDDHSAHLAATPGPLGVEHHALDDAICQARAVCAAYARMGFANTEKSA